MNTNKGFSLVEVVLVMVILGILLTTGSGLFQQAFETGFVTKDQQKARTQAQFALERMNDELKNARSATSSDLTPNASDITFVDDDGESIKYSISGTNLMRNSNILVSDISSLSFTYLKEDNSTTTTAADVRCIVISVTATKNISVVTMTTTVCPRNYLL